MTETSELGFPLRGSFKRVPVSKLVLSIEAAKATGNLFILSGDVKKVVFFETGKPVFVRSNVISECLGQRMVASGLISEEECTRTLDAIRRTGKKQGELLVEEGVLSSEQLDQALLDQLQYKLEGLFSLVDGRYQFKEGESAPGDFRVPFEVDIRTIIVQGIQAANPKERISLALDKVRDRYPIKKDVLSGYTIDLATHDKYFFECLDGSRSTTDVIEAVTPEQEIENPEALLYALYRAGLLGFLNRPMSGKPLPSHPNAGAQVLPEPVAHAKPAHQSEAFLPAPSSKSAVDPLRVPDPISIKSIVSDFSAASSDGVAQPAEHDSTTAVAKITLTKAPAHSAKTGSALMDEPADVPTSDDRKEDVDEATQPCVSEPGGSDADSGLQNPNEHIDDDDDQTEAISELVAALREDDVSSSSWQPAEASETEAGGFHDDDIEVLEEDALELSGEVADVPPVGGPSGAANGGAVEFDFPVDEDLLLPIDYPHNDLVGAQIEADLLWGSDAESNGKLGNLTNVNLESVDHSGARLSRVRAAEESKVR